MNKEQVILLVEDSDYDAELTLMSFKEARISNPVVRVADGVEALDYLFARGAHADRDPGDLPAVVLLDLNLPRVGGLEVLSAIRAEERTKYLPVVVLTSSDEDKDRVAAYSQCANSYVCKPVDYNGFAAAAQDLGLYWLVLNEPST
ncbi:MAG TPA: response regulator [Holophagaceae bacterium]|jgi:two-component system response regulator|nr:response regulator [Holophagaceae bacterium]